MLAGVVRVPVVAVDPDEQVPSDAAEEWCARKLEWEPGWLGGPSYDLGEVSSEERVAG